jgi:SSS family solute:Na+ symporter
MVLLAFMMIPIFNNPEQSIINTVQQLYGLLSMPILSAFIVGLLFKNVDAHSVILAVILAVGFYFYATNPLGENQNIELHYIHLMAITLILAVTSALVLNKLIFKQNASWDAVAVFGRETQVE